MTRVRASKTDLQAHKCLGKCSPCRKAKQTRWVSTVREGFGFYKEVGSEDSEEGAIELWSQGPRCCGDKTPRRLPATWPIREFDTEAKRLLQTRLSQTSTPASITPAIPVRHICQVCLTAVSINDIIVLIRDFTPELPLTCSSVDSDVPLVDVVLSLESPPLGPYTSCENEFIWGKSALWFLVRLSPTS